MTTRSQNKTIVSGSEFEADHKRAQGIGIFSNNQPRREEDGQEMQILMHGFHKGLLSVVTSIEARVAEIKQYKPEGEQAIRLRLIQVVPPEVLPREVAETGLAINSPFHPTPFRRWNDFFKACMCNHAELEELHKKLCLPKNPDCPWDGVRILPDVREAQ